MNKLAAALVALLFITACNKENGQNSKTGIKITLTATNTYDFDDIKVSFSALEYQVTTDSGTVWKQLPLIDTSSTGFINMHTILHGNGTDLSNVETTAGHIRNLRVKFASKAYVSRAGSTYLLNIPDNLQQEGAIVPADYTMANGRIQSIVLVYNTNRSIVSSSDGNSFTFSPNFRTFDPAMCGNIEGYVKPDAARPYATIYTDTVANPNAAVKLNEVTIPYSGGYFKLIGVPAGKCNVKLSALDTHYTSQSALNVNIVKGVTTQVGTYTLKN